MPEFKVSLHAFSAAEEDSAGWANLDIDNVSVVALINESDEQSATWSVDFSDGATAGGIFDSLGATSGDAAWIPVMAARTYHTINVSESSPYIYKITGSPNTDITVECFSSYTGDRSSRFWLNSGTPQDLGENNNLTNTVTLTGSTDATGEAFLYVSQSPSSGFAHFSAFRVIAPDAPSITLDNATRAPGQDVTGTATNFSAQPTTLSMSDGASPDYEPTPTFTASGDDWDFSATIEDFAAQAKAAGEGVPVQGLIPGTITVTVE